MNQTYILFHPQAGSGRCKESADILEVVFAGSVCVDVSNIESYETFLSHLDVSDQVILCGGDGMLNHFVNATKDIPISNPIYYYPGGNGNDFARDLGLSEEEAPDCPLNDYFRALPSVTVHGTQHLFLNNVGSGIDGYCCEEGDKLREECRKTGRNKPINYTALAIKGLLFHFSPRNAVVTVDGAAHTYKKVWIAPVMNGRYYGGGMMAAPEQDRLDPDKALSVMIVHDAGRLKTLCIFPSIFKGKHIRHKKHVAVLTGHEITVEFDSPAPLQIDGETIPDVLAYQARSYRRTPAERTAYAETFNETT